MKHKNINKKKKKVDSDENTKLSRSQKRREKLLKKKQQKEEDIDEFKEYKDKVEFGEVVHAPPELKITPKTSANKNPNRVIFCHLFLKCSF